MSSPLCDFEKRFWFKVWPRGDCWEWRGSRDRKGYGHVNDGHVNLLREPF